MELKGNNNCDLILDEKDGEIYWKEKESEELHKIAHISFGKYSPEYYAVYIMEELKNIEINNTSNTCPNFELSQLTETLKLYKYREYDNIDIASYKLEISKLDKEIMYQYRNYIQWNEQDSPSTEHKNFVKVTDKLDNIIGIAIFTSPGSEQIAELVKTDLSFILETEELEKIDDFHIQLQNRVYLDVIYSIEKNKGVARKIIAYLEDKYKYIWGCKWNDSEEFLWCMDWKALSKSIYINKEKMGDMNLF